MEVKIIGTICKLSNLKSSNTFISGLELSSDLQEVWEDLTEEQRYLINKLPTQEQKVLHLEILYEERNKPVCLLMYIVKTLLKNCIYILDYSVFSPLFPSYKVFSPIFLSYKT
jgi:hypothetical protein